MSNEVDQFESKWLNWISTYQSSFKSELRALIAVAEARGRREQALTDAKICEDMYEAGVLAHIADPSGNYMAKANSAHECSKAIRAQLPDVPRCEDVPVIDEFGAARG